MEPPRAVFFDIGQVLVRYDPRQAARAWAKLLGRHPMKVARYLWGSDVVDRIERGALKPEDIYGLFKSELGFTGDYDAFKRLWSGFFRLNPGVARLAQRLKARHRVYLLSNTNELHWDFIRRRFSFARNVDGAVLSYELGERKPEPAIYLSALRLAQVEPERCVFIDDRRENVLAAARMGFRAIHFKSEKDLRAELIRAGALDR
jgi:HAD superfamily hydrolase (TIGR01509 family)